MKIAFISAWFPFPTDNGSKIRILNLLKGLSIHHQVTLFSFCRESDYQQSLAVLNKYCRKVFVAPWREFDPGGLHARIGYFSKKPRSMVDTYSPMMERLIQIEMDSDNGYDLVIFSELNSLNYHSLFHGTPALLEDLELGAIYDESKVKENPLQGVSWKLTWWKTTHYLNRLLPELQAVTVVSGREKEILATFAPEFMKVEIIPNGIELSEYPYRFADPKPYQIIFSGSLRFPANFEAMHYFVSDIFPFVKKEFPFIKLIITGNQEGIMNLPGQGDPGIIYTGYVKNVHTLVASSWVSIVPLKTGGGTRLKILESMALGTPVVATSKGVEGLGAENNSQILIADTPDQFAQSVIKLIKDTRLRINISEQGRQLVEREFDWSKIMIRFLEIIENIGYKN